MNKHSIFATPFVCTRYKDQLFILEMIGLGYNTFSKPFEYMKYEEKEFTF